MRFLKVLMRFVIFMGFAISLVAINGIIAIGIFVVLNQAFYSRVDIWDLALFGISVPVINIIAWELFRYVYIDND